MVALYYSDISETSDFIRLTIFSGITAYSYKMTQIALYLFSALQCTWQDCRRSSMFVVVCLLAQFVPNAAFGDSGSQVEYTNHDGAMYGNLPNCIQAMQSFTSAKSPGKPALLRPGNTLSILSWNVQKGASEGWLADLKRLGTGQRLVLLQEALLTPQMHDTQTGQLFWSFAPGYSTDAFHSGLLMFSDVAPDIVCRFQVLEPWLGSPKATGAALFAIPDRAHGLLVVNLHAVNFSFGLSDFEHQLTQVSQLLRAVNGPAVVVGDFNTWRKGRLKKMNQLMVGAGLREVSFPVDKRVRFFGLPLDYIWARGLRRESSFTEAVMTSDHNPLMVTFRLDGKQTNATK